jgi:hypothetical protein
MKKFKVFLPLILFLLGAVFVSSNTKLDDVPYIKLTNDTCDKNISYFVQSTYTGGYWNLSGTNVFPVDLSYNVGIGTTGPSVPLHVKSTSDVARFEDSNGGWAPVDIVNTAGGDPFIRLYDNTSVKWAFGLDNSDGDKFKIAYDSSLLGTGDKVTIDTSGNVGIGTTAPTSLLHVESGDVNFSNGTNAQFFFDSDSGRIGIGTDSPVGLLDVKGKIYGTNVNNYLDLITDGQLASRGDVILRIDSDGNSAAKYLSIRKDTNTELMRVQEDGKVGINEMSPGSLLAVSGSATIGAAYASTAAPSNGLLIEGNLGIGTTSPDYPLHVIGNTSSANGTISIYADKNISATGYITRTTIFDTNEDVWDYIYNADDYLVNGDINHTKFYGYAGEFVVTDLSRPVEVDNITTYPYTKTEKGISLDEEINLLRQAVYELKQDNLLLEAELCSMGRASFCQK